jgi:hypothetical protein
LTVRDLLAEVVPQEPPVVVRVKVTLAADDADAVYVVMLGVVPELLVKDPPAPPSDHTAPVAPPPNEPPKAAVVAAWHTAETAEPALTVGFAFTVNVWFEVAVPQEPPLVVSVSVILLPAEDDAV